MARQSSSRAWLVVAAGVGINLALGVLYSWSVIAKTLTKAVEEGGWGWTANAASLPYALAMGVFALSMVFAGRVQDKFGPRIVATIGGTLTGLGMIAASFGTADNHLPIVLGFGVMTGLGIGLGYASATPASVKWFDPAKKGLITGIVVAGFGLASVYIAPTTTALLATDGGVPYTFRTLGIAFLIGTVLLAQLLNNPPAGYVPAAVAAKAGAAPAKKAEDFEWSEVLRTRAFYELWIMYAFSAFAGLMIIGHMAKIAGNLGFDFGYLLVAVLAIGNASGRIIAGMVSDRIGTRKTMMIVFILQALIMGGLYVTTASWMLIALAVAMGLTYGANLTLFPAANAGFFGTKNMGVNYGLVFTAWGVGGVFGSMTAASIVDATGSYAMAYAIAAGLSIAAAALAFVSKPPKHHE